MEVLSQPPLGVRVYNFLLSNSVACLRDVYEALSEKPSRFDHCLRRLWKKNLILRTHEPTYQFEVSHKGRAGFVGYTRAINHYVVNDGQEIGSEFVSYEDRKKDGKSRGILSKASKKIAVTQSFKLNSVILFFGEKMIGAVVFLIFFVLVTLISLVVGLPPGIYVHEWFGIHESEYSSVVNGIVNGVVYGVVVWLVFSLAKMGRKKEPVKPPLLEKALEVEKPKESKLLIELTEIKGIGPKNARKLKAAGVKTVSDLARRSAKDLSEKTGISIKDISRWIVQANEMIK